mgnify:CR=1 FL=1
MREEVLHADPDMTAHVARLLYYFQATGPMHDIMAVSDPSQDITVIFSTTGREPFSFGSIEEQSEASAFLRTKRVFPSLNFRGVNARGVPYGPPGKH